MFSFKDRGGNVHHEVLLQATVDQLETLRGRFSTLKDSLLPTDALCEYIESLTKEHKQEKFFDKLKQQGVGYWLIGTIIQRGILPAWNRRL